jgi:TolA-binding protein
MTSIAAEDLLVRARRGELGEDEARRFEIAVGSSRELELLYEAGMAFDAQAELLPGDEERMGALVAGALQELERAEPSRVAREARPLPRRRSDARFFATSVGFGMLLAVALASAWQAAERRHWLGGAAERPPAPPAVPSLAVPRAASPAVVAMSAATAVPASRAPVNPPRRFALTGGAPSSRAVVNELGSAPTREPAPAPASPSELFTRANEARRSGHQQTAIELYEELIARYPTAVEAEDARVLVGNLRLGQRSPSAALDEFERYGAIQGALTPEALWGRARALRSLESAEERQVLERIVREYPSSPYANSARQRLRQLSP